MRYHRHLTPGVGLSLVLGTLVLYIATLAPDVPPTDSGELILAAWLPGIAHAPGFPLYILLGWIWSHLVTLGSVAWRLNLFSAVMGALAVGLVFALMLRLLRAGRRAEQEPVWTPLAAGAGAALFAVGRTTWSWATVAEVYALNLAVTAGMLLLLVEWTGVRAPSLETSSVSGKARRVRRHRERSGSDVGKGMPRVGWERRDPLLAGAALLFGLGLGAHLTSIALLAPAIALWLTAQRGRRVWWSLPARIAAIGLLLGTTIYLYLPLRAASSPLLNWGDPDTWQRFWWQLTGKQYRVSLFSSPVWPQVILTAKLWWTQFTPAGLALALLGAWQMARRRKDLFWFLSAIVTCATLYAWAYVIEDDQDAYHLTAFLAGSIWVAWGGRSAMIWTAERWPRARSLAAGALVAIPLLALAWNFSVCNRSADTISADYAHDVISEIAPGGLLLTRDWQLYAPVLYYQGVEGYRTDVTVVDTELLRRGWYFSLLHQQDPELMASVAEEEARFLQFRDAWERGDIPDNDPRIQQLQESYVALIDAFITQAQAAGRTVHVGPNRGVASVQQATLQGVPDMEQGVGSGFNWIPAGLTFAGVANGDPAPEPIPLSWHIVAFQNVVPTSAEQKVLATRTGMATLHGMYLASLGQTQQAAADFRLARSLDPEYQPAAELLRRIGEEP